MSHQLYRHFDADGRLLYIGKSISAVLRLSGHGAKSGWYFEIARVEIQNFASEEALSAAEAAAITAEQPLHNVIHKNSLALGDKKTVWLSKEMAAQLKVAADRHGVPQQRIAGEAIDLILAGKYKL